MTAKKKVVLAYSGGLDTSYCIPYLREERGYEVYTVTVDTGGFDADQLRRLEARARRWERHATSRSTRARRSSIATSPISSRATSCAGVYPLVVAAERVVQAEVVADVARREQAAAVAHGSTGAGNDQVRFDIAFNVLLPGLAVIAPIRDEKLTRDEEYRFLEERGVQIDRKVRQYSINSGLWGATMGGGETHDPWTEIPEAVWEQAVGGEPRRLPRRSSSASRRASRRRSTGRRWEGWTSSGSSGTAAAATGSGSGSTSATPCSGSRAASPSRRARP